MALNLAPKRFRLASNSADQAKAVLAALDQLTQNAAALAQAGGNFAASDFDGTDPSQPSTTLVYLDPYDANVVHQQAIGPINAFLDTHVNNDAGLATYREFLLKLASGPV